MNFQKIVTVSGLPGLYRLKNYNKKGYHLESIESGRVRFVANDKNKVLALGNIDLVCYDRTIPLLNVFQVVSQTSLPIPKPNSSDQEVMDFFRNILPDYDEKKLFPSLLKKVVHWYKLLISENAEIIDDIENEKDDGLKITSENK